MANKFIKKDGKYYRINSDNTSTEVLLKDGYFTWTLPDKVRVKAKYDNNLIDMDNVFGILQGKGLYRVSMPGGGFTTASSMEEAKLKLQNAQAKYSDASENIANDALFTVLGGFPKLLYNTAKGLVGTTAGNIIGNTAGSMAIGSGLEMAERKVAGQSAGDFISNKLLSVGVPQVVSDMARPEYFINPTGAVYNAGKALVKDISSRFTPLGFRIGNYAYKPDMSVLYGGVPGKVNRTPLPKRRKMYYEYGPAYVKKFPEIPNGRDVIEEGLSIRGPLRIVADTEAQFSRVNDNLEFQNMFNLQHKYGLDFSKYPRTHYEYNGVFRTIEIPEFGPKKLPLISRNMKSNDVMYSHAHTMWNLMSKETRKQLEPIFSKIWKNVPLDGRRSPGERAFAISKDIQTSLNNKFLTDNRFSVKDYNEWLEYVDDIPDEILLNLAKRVHGGHWYENSSLDLSEQGLNALRETLKYHYGGKLKERSL